MDRKFLCSVLCALTQFSFANTGTDASIASSYLPMASSMHGQETPFVKDLAANGTYVRERSCGFCISICLPWVKSFMYVRWLEEIETRDFHTIRSLERRTD